LAGEQAPGADAVIGEEVIMDFEKLLWDEPPPDMPEWGMRLIQLNQAIMERYGEYLDRQVAFMQQMHDRLEEMFVKIAKHIETMESHLEDVDEERRAE